MEIEELNARIDEIRRLPSVSLELFFVFGADENSFARSVVMDAETQRELADLFASTAASAASADDQTVQALSTSDQRSGAIYLYDYEDKPQHLELLTEAVADPSEEQFNQANDDLAGLKAILAVVGDQESQFAVYKRQYPVELLRPGRWVGLMPNSENRFSKLSQDIVKVNGSFDMLHIDGETYVFNLSTLEKFFGFHDIVRKTAEAYVEEIAASELLQDVEPLQERLTETAFARRLIRSATNSPVLSNIAAETVVEFAKNHSLLKNKLKVGEDGRRFVLTTRVSQDLFLKLINDDFLLSELTDRQYESLAKDVI